MTPASPPAHTLHTLHTSHTLHTQHTAVHPRVPSAVGLPAGARGEGGARPERGGACWVDAGGGERGEGTGGRSDTVRGASQTPYAQLIPQPSPSASPSALTLRPLRDHLSLDLLPSDVPPLTAHSTRQSGDSEVRNTLFTVTTTTHSAEIPTWSVDEATTKSVEWSRRMVALDERRDALFHTAERKRKLAEVGSMARPLPGITLCDTAIAPWPAPCF